MELLLVYCLHKTYNHLKTLSHTFPVKELVWLLVRISHFTSRLPTVHFFLRLYL